MLFYNGIQLLEGIDSIEVKIQPHLYKYLDLTKQIDKYNRFSITTNIGLFFHNGELKKKPHHYIHISGEYINHKLPIIDTIAEAILTLLEKEVIYDGLYNQRWENNISIEDIKRDIFSYICGIYKVEFCFDFSVDNLFISNDIEIVETSDYNSLIKLLQKKQKDRDKVIIKYKDTLYSYDYNNNRISMLKLYLRDKRLIGKNNEFPVKFIKKNPYKYRIEFSLTRYNCSYLTLNNFDGNYQKIINQFTLYLAKQYNKYFTGKIVIRDTSLYPNFSRIYDFASIGFYYNEKLLDTITDEKIIIKQYEKNKYDSIINNNKRIDNDLFDDMEYILPNNYFIELDDNERAKYLISPFDCHDKDKVLCIDDDFVFYKNKYILPKYKNIEG